MFHIHPKMITCKLGQYSKISLQMLLLRVNISYLLDRANASHLSRNDHVKVGTISKDIFSKTLIKSHYLVSPGQSIQHYEWRFMPMNMNIVFPLLPFPISIHSTTMPSSTKVTSTTSMAKTTGTNKDVTETTKKKKK